MAVDGCSVKASNYRYPTSVLAVISLVVEVLLLEKVTGALFEAKHSDACALPALAFCSCSYLEYCSNASARPNVFQVSAGRSDLVFDKTLGKLSRVYCSTRLVLYPLHQRQHCSGRHTPSTWGDLPSV